MSDYLVKRLRAKGGITCISAAFRIKTLETKLELVANLLKECRPFVGYQASVDDLLSEIDATLEELEDMGDE